MDIKLNRMDVKPNRPVRVGNKMMRSGEGGTEFHDQVDAVLADSAPGESDLAAFREALDVALSAEKAKVEDLEAQLQDACTRIADLADSHTALTSNLAAANASISTLAGQVGSIQQQLADKAAAEAHASKPTAKAAEKAAKAD